jgi:subtilisin family serine protease
MPIEGPGAEVWIRHFPSKYSLFALIARISPCYWGQYDRPDNMIRPRDILARHNARSNIGNSSPARGTGRVLALIDGIPDLRTEELIGASVEVLAIAVDPTAVPDPHTTFAACVLVGREHGLIPHAHLLTFGVTAADGSIAPEHIAWAITEAGRRGAEIIVIPLGDHRDHQDVRTAIEAARARGVVIVAAAGNAHPHPLLFPARLPGVVAVGACDEAGALLEDCCRTPRPDLVLPALRVLATDGPGREVARSGTSVAATLAAGLLAIDFPPHVSTPSTQETP